MGHFDRPLRLVLGATPSHEEPLAAALRSLRAFGGVPALEWTVMVSGPADGIAGMSARLRGEFPGAEIVPVDPASSDFSFLEPAVKRGLHALYFDYLRAWIGRHLAGPYLWIDSDVIVRSRLEVEHLPLEAPIAMAADFPTLGIPFADFHWRIWSAYCRMLTACGAAERTPLRDADGHAQNMNCGVLYVREDISAAWRQTFETCLPILPEYKTLIAPPPKYEKGAESTFGQGVWNVLYAGLGGKELPWRWNNLRMIHPDRQGILDHYAVDKDSFQRDAGRLGLFERPSDSTGNLATGIALSGARR
jgi:hypothetical protein